MKLKEPDCDVLLIEVTYRAATEEWIVRWWVDQYEMTAGQKSFESFKAANAFARSLKVK